MVHLHEVLVILGFCLAISVCEFDLGLVILVEVSVAGHVVCLN